MTTETKNEAAERLHDAMAHFLNRGVRIQMIEDALAAERRAMERIRERLLAPIPRDVRLSSRLLQAHLLAILDEQAAR